MTEPPQIELDSNGTPDDEPVYVCFSASLRIFGDDVDIGEITRMLGITPTYSHRKGEQRSSGASPWPHDMWCFEPAVDEGQPLHVHLMELWDAIRLQIPYLRGLKHKYHLDV